MSPCVRGMIFQTLKKLLDEDGQSVAVGDESECFRA